MTIDGVGGGATTLACIPCGDTGTNSELHVRWERLQAEACAPTL